MADSKTPTAKQAVKAAENNDPANAETVTHEESGVQRDGSGTDEVRVGLATGSLAGSPDIPDKLPINKTVEGVKPEENTSADLSVAVKADGKKGPAA
jgi:hypothetical protein